MDKLTVRRNEEHSLSPFWNSFVLPILRYKKMTYIIVGTSVLATLIYCLVIPNMYTSTATILPSGDIDQLADLKDIAGGSLAELGLGSLIQASSNSSAIYPKILTSRLISENILSRRFDFMHKGQVKSMTLSEYIDAANIDLALRKLNKLVKVDLDRRTGFITVAVTTKYPEMSAAIVHAYLELLDDYNVNHRQSKAKDNVRFIARRLKEAKKDLDEAESALEQFRQKNLNYVTSQDPALQNELSKLERNGAVKETIYLTLTKKHELAKLEAAKDVPIVQVLDRGSVPLVKSSPRRSIYMLAAFFGSLFMSVLLSLWFDLSAKRKFRANLENVIISQDVKLNRLEKRLVRRATQLASIIETRANQTEPQRAE